MTTSHATRFVKGRSGNPKGRPRSRLPQPASAFDILLDRTLTITQAGTARTMTVEEALQHKIYEQAVAGKRTAVRKLLKMIARREKALAAKAPPAVPVRSMLERHDPANAYNALQLLDIAIPDPDCTGVHDGTRLLLQTWAVQAALSRRTRKALDKDVIAAIERLTDRPHKLRWPRSNTS